MRLFVTGSKRPWLPLLCALWGCDGTITNSPADLGADASTSAADVDAQWQDEVDGGNRSTMLTLALPETDDDFPNPERGFYAGVNLLSATSAQSVADDGHTVAIALVRLDDYRDRPLDAELLDALDDGFASVRGAGIKVILRFMYNASFTDDAPKARVLEHIAQLSPLLHDNADVIAVMQAGFIGAWGEWHGSTNGLDAEDARAEILTALLDALPASRVVQVRTPMYKEGAFPGGPLDEPEAFSGTHRARTGHHNDCFLASESDMGTYASPVTEWKAYVSEDTRYTPMGGETCAVYEPLIECGAAIEAMARNHWSYLNREYRQEVIDAWVAAGCEPEIWRRLGYRFAALSISHSELVAPGGELAVEIDIANRGFAAPFNARPVYLVLSGNGERRAVRLANADPRHWEPGESHTIATTLRIPAGLAPGSYALSMWMPDEAPALSFDPRYAVRLANEGVWDPASGDNVLSEQVTVDPTAPGPIDPTAPDLIELP